MDIKPSSSLITALGQQADGARDVTKTIRRQSQEAEARSDHLQAKKAKKREDVRQKREVDEANKASSLVEIKAAQKRVENVRTINHREAPLAIAGPPAFQKLGQIIDIRV